MPLMPLQTRKRLAQLMFDTIKVEAVFIANSAVLSLFSTGRTTGIVLEMGEGVSHIVPVYEGFALPHAVLRLPLAGADVTNSLVRVLVDRGVTGAAPSTANSSCVPTTPAAGGLSLADQHLYVVRDIKGLCAACLRILARTRVFRSSREAVRRSPVRWCCIFSFCSSERRRR